MLIGKCIFLTTALQTVLSHTCIPFELLVLAFRKQLRVVMGDEFGSGTCRAPRSQGGLRLAPRPGRHAPTAGSSVPRLVRSHLRVCRTRCEHAEIDGTASPNTYLPIR